MEFLLLMCFLFLIVISFVAVSGYQMKKYSDNQKKELVEDFGYSLKKEVDIASVVKDGYHRTVILPDKIDASLDYSISMSNATLIILTETYEYNGIIPQTIGSLKKGSNIIKKINNQVQIENV